MKVSYSMAYLAFLLIASWMGVAEAENSSAFLQKAANGQCIDGVTLEQPSRNRLECMRMCSDLGTECQSVSFLEGVCMISSSSDTTSCQNYSPVYRTINALTTTTTTTTTTPTTTTATTKPTTTTATTTVTHPTIVPDPSTLPSESSTSAASSNLALNRPVINNTSPWPSNFLPARTTDGVMSPYFITDYTDNPFVLFDLETQYLSTELQINIWTTCGLDLLTNIEIRISDSSAAEDLDSAAALCAYRGGAAITNDPDPYTCTPESSTFRYIKIVSVVTNNRLCIGELEVFRVQPPTIPAATTPAATTTPTVTTAGVTTAPAVTTTGATIPAATTTPSSAIIDSQNLAFNKTVFNHSQGIDLSYQPSYINDGNNGTNSTYCSSSTLNITTHYIGIDLESQYTSAEILIYLWYNPGDEYYLSDITISLSDDLSDLGTNSSICATRPYTPLQSPDTYTCTPNSPTFRYLQVTSIGNQLCIAELELFLCQNLLSGC